MSKVVVQNFAVSVDGFAAGIDQSVDNPLGVRGPELMEWFFETRTWQEMHGLEGGEIGVDDGFASDGMAGNGAWILGRNMFGPVRGPWRNEEWKGWWGDEPPYHTQVFVLTHHKRKPIPMKGSTTFHFITDGIRSALNEAKAAAGDLNIRIGGGPSTVRQYLLDGLIDRLHLVMRPILLGEGEPLFHGLNFSELGYKCERWVPGERAVHLFLQKES